MFATAAFVLSLTLATDAAPPSTVDLGARPGMACWAPAKGRKDVPIRENYMTYSPVVGHIARDQVFWGERVPNENKVLVRTTDHGLLVGIARHSFLREVDREACAGAKLYAPLATELFAWTTNGDENPIGVRPPSNLFSHHGCYELKPKGRLRPFKNAAPFALEPGDLFFGASDPDGKLYPDRLTVLDPAGGAPVATVAVRDAVRVPYARCSNAASRPAAQP
jgi:hypothetical protein